MSLLFDLSCISKSGKEGTDLTHHHLGSIVAESNHILKEALELYQQKNAAKEMPKNDLFQEYKASLFSSQEICAQPAKNEDECLQPDRLLSSSNAMDICDESTKAPSCDLPFTVHASKPKEKSEDYTAGEERKLSCDLSELTTIESSSDVRQVVAHKHKETKSHHQKESSTKSSTQDTCEEPVNASTMPTKATKREKQVKVKVQVSNKQVGEGMIALVTNHSLEQMNYGDQKLSSTPTSRAGKSAKKRVKETSESGPTSEHTPKKARKEKKAQPERKKSSSGAHTNNLQGEINGEVMTAIIPTDNATDESNVSNQSYARAVSLECRDQTKEAPTTSEKKVEQTKLDLIVQQTYNADKSKRAKDTAEQQPDSLEDVAIATNALLTLTSPSTKDSPVQSQDTKPMDHQTESGTESSEDLATAICAAAAEQFVDSMTGMCEPSPGMMIQSLNPNGYSMAVDFTFSAHEDQLALQHTHQGVHRKKPLFTSTLNTAETNTCFSGLDYLAEASGNFQSSGNYRLDYHQQVWPNNINQGYYFPTQHHPVQPMPSHHDMTSPNALCFQATKPRPQEKKDRHPIRSMIKDRISKEGGVESASTSEETESNIWRCSCCTFTNAATVKKCKWCETKNSTPVRKKAKNRISEEEETMTRKE